MTFEEYQKHSKETAQYPKIGEGYVYPVLGLVNEAGEVAGKIKKIFRDDAGELTSERRDAIVKELGDVLWYLSQIASELNLSFEDIARMNLDRLKSRKERGVINGDGDNR